MRSILGTGVGVALLSVVAGIAVAQDVDRVRRAPVGEMPPVRSIALNRIARDPDRALLLVEPERQPELPGAFPYPHDNETVVVNDIGEAGDRRAGDGIYSAIVPFDRARLERQISGNLESLRQGLVSPPPRLSTRFDPVLAGRRPGEPMRPGTIDRRIAERPATRGMRPALAARQFQARALRDARDAMGALRLPAERWPEEVFRLERVDGRLRAILLGRPVLPSVLFGATVSEADIDPDRSLLVTDPQVVNDPTRTFDICTNAGNPNGVWSFKHLVTQMANEPATGISPEQFVWNWLTLSAFQQEANNFIAPARPGYVAMVRDRWARGPNGEIGPQHLDLDKAPFRLLAIVSRTDLADAGVGYGGGSAGEARFVFGVLDPDQPCGSPPATVIFEYGIEKNSCPALKSWTQSWFDLSDAGLVMGSGGTYNQKLEQLTQSFVMAGANPNQTPNQNAIAQVRTNEFLNSPWTLFEYRLIPSGTQGAGNLDLVTVKQTPAPAFLSGTQAGMLANWIDANEAALLAHSHTVPTMLSNGHPFLGAHAPTPGGFTWTNAAFPTPPANQNALFNFSVNTCNGCHAGDTATSFTHISPRGPSGVAAISAFMRHPNDPQDQIEDDLERRQRLMANALNSQCMFLPVVAKLPGAFVH